MKAKILLADDDVGMREMLGRVACQSRPHHFGRCRNETGKTAELWRRRDAQNNKTKTTRQSATNNKNMKNQKNRYQTKSTAPQESQARPTEE